MGELSFADNVTWIWISAAIAVVLVGALIYRYMHRPDRLRQVLSGIAFDRIDDVIVPNGEDGEIQIDHVLLTSRGILIVDIKDVHGAVFGGDNMQDWTVISKDRRFTFPNPQPGLLDRIAALRDIVQQVPVQGRILFLESAQFSKGVPQFVTSLDKLEEEFGEADKSAAAYKIEAFKPHWELIPRPVLAQSD